MKEKILFHGSEIIIQKPNLEFSSEFNDYGRGFYCTEDEELAKEWACKRENDGFANKYLLKAQELYVLELTDDIHNVLNWIAILLRHRKFRLGAALSEEARDYIIKHFAPDTANCDIIIGYRADDSYFQYAEAFVENAIPVRLLNKALLLGNLGIQTAFISQKSLDALCFNGAIKSEREMYYSRFSKRDIAARAGYKKLLQENETNRNDVYVLDILREEMKADDPRLR